MRTFVKEIKLEFVLFSLAAILLVARFIYTLIYFNTIVTDNDQALFWYACDNFSNGLFYTPFIYGCNYGSMIESLLAVPFYKLGLPLFFALPISNAFWMFLLSVLVGVNLNFKYPLKHVGTIFLIIIALMPTEFYALSFAAKGHMSGIFTILICFILITRFDSYFSFVLVGAISGLAFQLNPNSLFLILVLGLFINDTNKLMFVGLGTLLSLTYFFITKHYLTFIDSEFLHKQWQITFSFIDLNQNLNDIDKYLNTVTPFFRSKGYISLIIPILLAIVAFKKKQWLTCFLTILIFFSIFLSFGINKITDGSIDILFHYSRFFLAIAFCNAIMIGLLFRFLDLKKYSLLITSIGLILIIFQIPRTKVEANLITEYCGSTYAVRKSLIKDLRKNCNWMIKVLNENKSVKTKIIVNDVLFYSENLYLSTLHLKNVLSCFENYKSFYWIDKIMLKNYVQNDIYFIINFDKTLERKVKQFPEYFHKDEYSSFFLVKNVSNPSNFIVNFMR